MRVLIVYAHPNPGSFNAAIVRELSAGLLEAGHTPDLADLYGEEFRADLDLSDFAAISAGTTPTDIAAHQERVRRADAFAFAFPVWWFGPPAILKGWIERVFLEGFAFRFDARGRIQGLLTQEKALVLNTAGGGEAHYQAFGFSRPLQQAFCEWTLKFCGVGEVKHVIFHEVAAAGDAMRQSYLRESRRLGKEFFGAAGES